MLKVLNVNSTLGLKTGGGTAERTFQMSRHLAKHGVVTTILTLDIELDEPRKQAAAPARVVSLLCLSKRFYIPLGGWSTVCKLVNESDVIHLMGHWSILNAMVYFSALRANKPYIVCPAGALPIFGRSALLKRIYNLLVGDAIIRNAAAWIAVTEGEFSDFESYGISSSRICVIPNGVSEEDFPITNRQKFLNRHHLPDAPLILFMGRLNLIKGPDLLLRAYIDAKSSIPTYHLVFAGPDEGMLNHLMHEVVQAGLSDCVHFIGYVSGDDKSASYHYAHLLVVPSRQEAMSIVALEAAICGTPVMLTDQCGFGEIKSVHSGLEVQADSSSIADGLIFLLSQPETLKEIGNSLQKFVIKTYTWQFIIKKYLALYNDLLKK